MKKNFTLFKTLLVAAGLCTGSSAWATDTNATLVHTAATTCGADKTVVTYTLDGATAHYNNEGSGTWQGYAFAEFSFALPAGEEITSATLTWKASTTATSRKTSIYYLNAGQSLDYAAISGETAGLLRKNGVKTWIVDYNFSNTASYETDVTNAVKALKDQGYIIFQWTNNAGGADLVGKGASADAPTLVITTTSSTTSYTVTFKDQNGTKLKENAVHTGIAVGATVSASSEEKANFNVDETTYTLLSGDESITTVANADNNVIELVFKKASVFNYTVKGYDKDDNELATIATGTYTEGTSAISVSYSQYILSGTTLYGIGGGYSYKYSTTFTPNEDNYVHKLTYDAEEIENVVFFTEAENISGVSIGNNGERASNGRMGYTSNADTYVDVTSLEPGAYQIHLKGQNGNSASRVCNLKVGNDVVFSFTIENGTNKVGTSEEFNVLTNSTLSFACVGSSASGADYFYIVKTGDATVSKTITAAGWATYCSPYALDFTGTGLTAYIVTGADAEGNLAKTPVTTVPANTGVLLKGAAGDYNISVVASSSTDVTENKMVGVTAETQLAATGGWVLMGSPSLGFYFNTNAFTLGANTAYIPVDDSNFTAPTSGAKARFFALDGGNATAINGIESEKNADNAAIYNLAGQRVNAGYKGIVIQNGKKYMNK